MWSFPLSIVFLTAAFLQGTQAESVTYGDLGSFTYGNGAPACHHAKPESPSAIVIQYWLYTQSNKNSAQKLTRTSSSSITNSNFKNTNVIMVDWKEGAGRANYAQSRANTRVVGRDIGKLIEKLKSTTGASYGSMHIIGHSLGAHTAGYAGESRSSIGRLTGLDPAGPEFTGYGAQCCIDKSDATFVDIIHTDGETTGAGLLDQLGHQDFYPNGGESQPGCAGTPVIEACDHMRAVYLFTSSITTNCFKPTKKCTNWSSYPNCSSCGTCPVMGYGASKSKGTGAYYLTTSNKSPYCN